MIIIKTVLVWKKKMDAHSQIEECVWKCTNDSML